jgi:hypothetical protein
LTAGGGTCLVTLGRREDALKAVVGAQPFAAVAPGGPARYWSTTVCWGHRGGGHPQEMVGAARDWWPNGSSLWIWVGALAGERPSAQAEEAEKAETAAAAAAAGVDHGAGSESAGAATSRSCPPSSSSASPPPCGVQDRRSVVWCSAGPQVRRLRFPYATPVLVHMTRFNDDGINRNVGGSQSLIRFLS